MGGATPVLRDLPRNRRSLEDPPTGWSALAPPKRDPDVTDQSPERESQCHGPEEGVIAQRGNERVLRWTAVLDEQVPTATLCFVLSSDLHDEQRFDRKMAQTADACVSECGPCVCGRAQRAGQLLVAAAKDRRIQ